MMLIKDFNTILEEYKKGNMHHLAVPKDIKKGYLFFIYVTELDLANHAIWSINYNITTNWIAKKSLTSSVPTWAWELYDFFILTSEEATPYINRLMIENLNK